METILVLVIFIVCVFFILGCFLFICCFINNDYNNDMENEESMKNNRRNILAQIKSTMKTRSLSIPRKKKDQLSHASVASSLRSYP